VILAFGNADTYRIGATDYFGVGTLGGETIPVAEVQDAIEGFMDGWWSGYQNGGGRSENPRAHLTIAAGINNWDLCNLRSSPCNYGFNMPREHGIRWAKMVDDLRKTISNRQYQSRLEISAALDSEYRWGRPYITRNWVDGYVGYFSTPTVAVPLYNFGACEDCGVGAPWGSTPPVFTKLSLTNDEAQYRNNKYAWTLEDGLYVSWSPPYLAPVPEIYNEVGAHAWQWATLSKYSADTNPQKGKIVFSGVLTNWKACEGLNCTGFKNAPERGWIQLFDTLFQYSAIRLNYIPWLSDMQYQDYYSRYQPVPTPVYCK